LRAVRASAEDERVLARLMRAEAEGEGRLGMLLVGNVGVNRVRSNCLDFKNIRTIPQMVTQHPGGFESTIKGYFYQKAREKEIRLARRSIRGETRDPATSALWFFRPEGDCPATWYNQVNTGRFKSHCFYAPTPEDCPILY
jgi:N-acetylmuramoyl-L-alanine amidase